jgi:hypothetical protein
MPAKSTHFSRINNAANLMKDIQNTDNSYFISIGKSDAWSDTATDFTDDNLHPELVNGITRSQTYEAQIRQNFLAMKRLTSSYVTHAIRRYDWVSGQSYVQWDSNDPDIFTKRFYVITDENRVYKCIKKGTGASSIKPTHNNATPTTESDGYMWRFMYAVSSVQVTRFLNNVYVPVKTVPQSGLSVDDDIQYANQLESLNIAGKIYTAKIVTGGSGYSSATVTITGNGTGATATATIVDGVITAINITATGSGYSVAQITISGGGGTGATATATLSPFGGHGYDPVKELGGEFIMASFNLIGDEEGTFIVNDDFRQVSLIKNPHSFGTTTIATADRLTAVRTMRLSSVTNGTQFITSNIGSVIQSSTDATIKAFVVSYDVASGDLKYTQNDKTGYKNFVGGSTITSNTGASGTIATLAQANPTVNIHSGNLLVVDNIQPVNRTTAGQESLTFIIQH